MARNGAGTYSKVNTFVAGNTITASGHNQNWDDLVSEMTNSVAADGQTPMTGPLRISSGTAAAPSLTFSSDTDVGLYRVSADRLGVALAGTQYVDFATATTQIMNLLVVSGAMAASATAVFGSVVIGGVLTASATAQITNLTVPGVLSASATAVFSKNPVIGNNPILSHGDAASTSQISNETTATNAYIRPDLLKHSKRVTQAWAAVTVSGGTPTLQRGFNVSSITDNGAGDYTVNFSTSFADSSYCAIVTVLDNTGFAGAKVYSRANGSVSVQTIAAAGTPTDFAGFFVAVFNSSPI